MRGMPHAAEIVPYPDRGAVLVRCHSCGARLWGADEEEAKALQRAHVIEAREGGGTPSKKVFVVLRADKRPESEVREYESLNDAVAFVRTASGSPHWWGWSFAILAGVQTPEHALNMVGSGEAADAPVEVVAGTAAKEIEA